MDSRRELPLTFCMVAAAASAATIYVIFGGFDSKPRKRQRGPRGLENTGRSCYLNAVLQAMASSKFVVDWLRSGNGHPLKRSLYEAFQILNRTADVEHEEEVVSLSNLYSNLRVSGFVARHDEQDAHELFQGLLDAMEGDTTNDVSPSSNGITMFGLNNEQGSSSPGIMGKSGITVVSEDAVNQCPFNGTMTSSVRKIDGKESSPTRSTAFNNVTLYLPKSAMATNLSGPVDLETLLQIFVSLEPVNEESTKQHTFARLPQCLCFHVQRTGFESGVPFKRVDPVAFPVLLNMDRFVYARQLCRRNWLFSREKLKTAPGSSPEHSRNNYALFAVISHTGAIDSGHYVTYRKCALPSGKSRWYFTSDAVVRPVDIDAVLAANPYMLFYEKLELPAEKNCHRD